MKEELTPEDFRSPTWLRLEYSLKKRVGDLRRQNDNPQLTDQETQRIRGKISELKRILGLPKGRPGQDDDSGE